MNCFQLIKTVLDEAYAEIPGTPSERDKSIRAQCTEMSAAYAELLTKGCLDYSNPARRFGYIFKYTTSHANIVCERIAGSKPLRSLFDRDRVLVSWSGAVPEVTSWAS